MTKSSTVSVLAASVVAFAGGFVAGMLLTPQAGAETRKQIAERARRHAAQLEDRVRELDEKYKILEQRVVESGTELGSKVRDMTARAVDQVIPDLSQDDASWDLERKDVAGDLRRIPRK